MPLHHVAWQTALHAAGARFEFGWDRFLSRAGMTLELTVEELNAELGLALDPHRVAARQRAEYERLEARVEPIQPVVDVLRSMSAQGKPVSVASGSARATVERTLRAIGVFDLVPWVVTAEEVRRGKPHPDLFLLAAERMGVPPERCLVFEDSPLGIQGAERAGMTAVLVRRPPRG
jgi:HAD superfamily hydrolase (TIGR01509 family)